MGDLVGSLAPLPRPADPSPSNGKALQPKRSYEDRMFRKDDNASAGLTNAEGGGDSNMPVA
jgi:hypothetical protein